MIMSNLVCLSPDADVLQYLLQGCRLGLERLVPETVSRRFFEHLGLVSISVLSWSCHVVYIELLRSNL